jgi:periplasmic divalent cation tolerance protein
MLPPDPQHHPAGDGSGMVLALTTEANEALAEALAEAVLEAELAACVALTPCRSLYRWQGVLERSPEVQLLIKCHPSRLEALWHLVRQRHSYTTPEWITWPVCTSRDYGAWLAGCCGVTGQAPAPAESA